MTTMRMPKPIPTAPNTFALHADTLPSLRIDFEDTYDGLGDQLDEADDDLNDDTFGAGDLTSKPPAKDFDFSGNTSKGSGAFTEEAVRYNRHDQPFTRPLATSGLPKQTSKPYKSGYEAYKNPGYIPDLQVDPSLWAPGPVQQSQPSASAAASQSRGSTTLLQKKMMSLEEVEAAMRAQPKTSSPAPPIQHQLQIPEPESYPGSHMQTQQSQAPPIKIMQHPQHTSSHPSNRSTDFIAKPHQSIVQSSRHVQGPYVSQAELPARASPAPSSSFAANLPQRERLPGQQSSEVHVSQQPRQILQNPKRHSAQLDSRSHEADVPAIQPNRTNLQTHAGGPTQLPIITHPSQLVNLSDEQRQTFMAEDAKRAKRNHKIYLLSKGNGLMTPQDKNFITRIQLQQLMTATGNVNEHDPDLSLAEDFYYQVYSQIENRPRQHPHQPLSNFAQTYLFQTGGRNGAMNKRHSRGDNHMHRMQQQVQRAVEAAKAKPKNKQLVIEGSLGKISFSNAKTPKPLLNIRRNEKLPQANLSTTDRKAILKNIEAVYAALMRIEDHDRHIPQQPLNEQDPASAEPYIEWRRIFKELNQTLWSDLKVMEPITPESTVLHPFIAFLSYPKGKKAIPRVFTHIDQEQRLTILTIIMIQLDTLDVIRSAQPHFGALQSRSVAREQVELFLQAVMPSLFSNVTEAPLNIITGLLSLVIDRVNVPAVARSQVGLEILTMLLSQAEIIRKGEATNSQDWEQWLSVYNRLFDMIEPLLADIFPGPVSAGQDVYVWQFLATLGTGANPEQQQRLVLAVKYVASHDYFRALTLTSYPGIVLWTLFSKARRCRQKWLPRGEVMSIFSCRLLGWM